MASNMGSGTEYYAESEEELVAHPGGQGLTSPSRVPAQAVKTPVVSRQFKNQEAAQSDFVTHALYIESIRTLYEMLRIDHLVLGSFRTTPILLEHFNLNQLILSADRDE